jgi:hypothetical protein
MSRKLVNAICQTFPRAEVSDPGSRTKGEIVYRLDRRPMGSRRGFP